MLKKLAKNSLVSTSILAGAALVFASSSHADTGSSTVLTYDPLITEVGVNSSGTLYQQTGLMQISAEVQVVVDAEVSGRVKSWKTWLMLRTEDKPWTEFKDSAAEKSYDRPRPGAVNEVTSVDVPHMSLSPLMVTYCNDMRHSLRQQGISNEEIFSQDRTIPVAIRSAHLYETTGIGDPFDQADIRQFSDFPKVYLVCKGRETEGVPPPPNHTVGGFQFDRGPFEPSAINISLNTYPNHTHQPHMGVTCPVLFVTTRVTANKAGLAGVKRIGQINGAPNTTANVYMNTTYQPDGSFVGLQTQKYYLGDGAQAKFYAAVQSGNSNISTPWKSTTINCTGSGTDYSQDRSDYEAKAGMALYDASGKGSRCPRPGHVGFTFSSNYSEPIDYRLTTNTGIDKSGTVQLSKSGSDWKGLVTVPFQVDKTMVMGAVLRQIRNGKATIVATKTREFACKTPIVNTASDGLAPTPQPGTDPDLPQGQTLTGDFGFADHGAPKCDRVAKALVTFRSPKSDNIHWSLDCKFQNKSGVVATQPHPDGDYMAVKLVSLDVTKTVDESCTLRTVAPYNPKDHVTKAHQFVCATPSGHSASNDVQVPSNPPSGKPDVPATLVPTVPHKVIVGTGTSHGAIPPWQCQGGTWHRQKGCICPPHKKPIYGPVNYHGKVFSGFRCVLSGPQDKTTTPGSNAPDVPQVTIACKDKERRVGGKCVKIPGVSIHCKPGYHQEGTECVRNPVKGVSTVDKAKSDAIKRRLEAAKKKKAAAIAAAAKARKLKAAQDAAIAKRRAIQAAKKAQLQKLQQQKARAAAAASAKARANALKELTAKRNNKVKVAPKRGTTTAPLINQRIMNIR